MPDGGDDRFDGLRPLGRARLKTVAVLPLFAFRHGTINRDFGAGIAFSITSALARFPEINVISASSTMGYLQRRRDPQAFARELGARYVVYGQVVQAEQELSFKVGLADVDAGHQAYFDPISCHISDLHNIDEIIVSRLIGIIIPSMHAAEVQKVLKQAQPGLAASAALLAAIPVMHRASRESMDQAERLLLDATAADPTSGKAYAWLARLNALRIGQGWTTNRRQACIEALRLARHALSLDPDNAMALTTAGHFHSYLQKDIQTGLAMMQRAVEIAPSDPYAWLMLATSLAYRGEAAEARQYAEHALRLSPLDVHVSTFHTFFALCHYVAEDYAEAVRHCRLALDKSPEYSTTWRALAVSLVGQGQLDEARRAAARMLELEPDYPSIAEETTPFLEPRLRERFLQHLAAAGLLKRGNGTNGAA